MTPSTSWPPTSGAPPLWATPRDRSRRTDGPLIAAIAASLGTPLLPWQRHVADVAGERLPNGAYAYRTVVVSVPRQTGKTTLIRAMGVQRALLGRSVFYSAQTGKDARARWSDLVEVLRTHPALAPPMTTVALRGGSEHVRFPSGAVFQAFAPTGGSLHGYTPPTVVLDEAFAHSASLGELLMGAIKPAQQTILDKQVWLVSTRGTDESTFFHDWIDRGVQGSPGVACFVWGAADHQDPFDRDDIAAFHPGVGFRLGDVVLSPDDVLSEAEGMSAAEYVRAYGNRSTRTTSNLIPRDAVAGLVDEQLRPPADLRGVTLAYDVAAHRRRSAIVAVWTDVRTGLPAARVVKAAAGASWLAADLVELDRAWRPARVVAVDNGPVLDVTTDVEAAGVRVTTLADREFAAASGAFLDHVEDGTVALAGGLDDPLVVALVDSVTGLVTRSAAVDGVAFSRRHSAGDTAPAIALVAGLRGHANGYALAAPSYRSA